MSLRILGGTFKGRPLKSPQSKTRPTTSILRKSLFDALQSTIYNARFCDLFAGSGSIGLEALSRGADCSVFIESHPQTFGCLLDNIKSLRVEKQSQLFSGKAIAILKKLEKAGERFDIIYIDPPYDIPDTDPSSYPNVLTFLDQSSLVDKGGLIFVENDNPKKIPIYLEGCKHLVLRDSRHFSDSWLHRIEKI